MELFFENLLYLHIGPRDEDFPMKEDLCVSAVLMVNPAVIHDDPCFRQVQEITKAFRLELLFQGGRLVEIQSETMSLVLSTRTFE